MDATAQDHLRQLADSYGVEPGYHDDLRRWHDAEPDALMAVLRILGASLHGLRFVDSRTDPRVQVADFLAGTARRIASDDLAGRGDPELTALVRLHAGTEVRLLPPRLRHQGEPRPTVESDRPERDKLRGIASARRVHRLPLRRFYEELVRRIKEAGINASFQNSSIRMADAARPPVPGVEKEEEQAKLVNYSSQAVASKDVVIRELKSTRSSLLRDIAATQRKLGKYEDAVRSIEATAPTLDDPRLLDLSIKLFDNDAGRYAWINSRATTLLGAISLAAAIRWFGFVLSTAHGDRNVAPVSPGVTLIVCLKSSRVARIVCPSIPQ